ncbi:LOW QUALITY PROTEIN: hypothetical protein CRUP_002213, partial [Coryphaenoides rupestris]
MWFPNIITDIVPKKARRQGEETRREGEETRPTAKHTSLPCRSAVEPGSLLPQQNTMAFRYWPQVLSTDTSQWVLKLGCTVPVEKISAATARKASDTSLSDATVMFSCFATLRYTGACPRCGWGTLAPPSAPRVLNEDTPLEGLTEPQEDGRRVPQRAAGASTSSTSSTSSSLVRLGPADPGPVESGVDVVPAERLGLGHQLLKKRQKLVKTTHSFCQPLLFLNFLR